MARDLLRAAYNFFRRWLLQLPVLVSRLNARVMAGWKYSCSGADAYVREKELDVVSRFVKIWQRVKIYGDAVEIRIQDDLVLI